MNFHYDATNVKPSEGGFPMVPAGWWPWKIIDATPGDSKKGHPMVTLDCQCLDPKYRDVEVKHWVVFMPPEQKGAGMAIHFLKCIGEPHEGRLNIEPFNWIGKIFMGKAAENEYTGKDGQKRKNNKLESISPIHAAVETDDPFAGEPR